MGGAEAKKTKNEHAEAAEAAPKKTENTAAADNKGHAKGDKKAKDGEVKERQVFERQRGTQWSLERCRKYARRFKTEADWMAGSPASYKAAAHWGWVAQCTEHMSKSPRLVHSNPATAAASNYASNPVNLVVVPGNKHGGHHSEEHASHNVHSMEKKKSKGTSKAAKAKDTKKKAS